MKKNLLFLIFFCLIFSGFAQRNPVWTKLIADNTLASERIDRNTTPFQPDFYELDLNALKATLSNAPLKAQNLNNGVIVEFPTAKGTVENFRVYKTAVLHPDLEARYPDIKSYMGIGINDPTATIYFSTTIFGLHTMSFSGDSEVTYIDTYTKDLKKYIVYSRNGLQNNGVPFECSVAERIEPTTDAAKNQNTTLSNDGVLRTYRLAISSTVEYSAFHIAQAGVGSGTLEQKKAAVLAAMNVTMVRVNGVYQRDIGVFLQLIPNNDVLICITSDNFDNNDGSSLLGQNQSFVNANIGTANYDMGHIFSTGGGGVAFLQSVCSPGSKARGVTGSASPVNDPFNIDYVAHEMGHQFGGNHTFSSNMGSCNGNRNDATAIEPGSGTTIMAYAGICNPHNVQNNSDAHFSFISLQEIDAFLNTGGGGSCAVTTPISNTPPVIAPLQSYIIPKGTPFVLKGNAIDAENDPLTYCWEQNNNEISTQPPVATSATGPNFRSRPPSVSPERYLPALNTALNNYEILPNVARTLKFVLTVRDNSPNGPQTSRADMTVTLANVGPFAVTSPNTNLTWPVGSNQTVTWDVAGTTANGINCAFVDIYLSTNSGSAYPILLASQVPNDGSEVITVPNNVSSTCKIMVRANDNIFYDISNANFSITAAPSTFSVGMNGVAGTQNKSICAGNSVDYTLNYAPLSGFTGTTTFSSTGAPAGSSVVFQPNSITAAGEVAVMVTTSNITAPGFYAIAVNATSGATTKTVNVYLSVTSGNFVTQTLVSPADQSVGVATEANLSWTANSANTSSYLVELASDMAFTTILTSATTSATSYTFYGLAAQTDYYWRVTPKNSGCSGTPSAVFQFKTGYCGEVVSTNVPIAINASGTPTINSTLFIPEEENVVLNDVNVTLNITHTKINNLTVRLTSPSGTQVTLFSSQCSPILAGVADAIATFDDGGTALACATSSPAISGRIIPAQALSALNGQNSQGLWTLTVVDGVNNNGGNLNSWSLDLCSVQSPMGVEDNLSSSFKVFPNPSNGSFTIQSDRLNSDKVNVQVYDIQGRVIFDNSFNGNGKLNENIKLNNAQAGVYLLSVTNGDTREVKRIVVK